ncbi:MAG: hypothetical protein PVJ57_05775 [Phycisphaerae bacterium]
MCQRLHADLRALVRLVPPEAASGASQLCRHLEIDRATCQRVLNTIRRPGTGADVLLGLPGVRGMRLFIAALSRIVGDNDALAAASATVERFRTMVKRLAGSQAKLCRRLRTPRTTTPPPPAEETTSARELVSERNLEPTGRRRLFELASGVVGRSSETFVALQAIRPVPDNPRQVEYVSAFGYIGHRAGPEALPLVLFHTRSFSARFATLQNEPLGPGNPLLPQFSSGDAMRLTPVHAQNPDETHLWQVVDLPPGDAVDIVTANRPTEPAPHPALRSPQLEEVWMIITMPARHGLLDVYLHRDLARISIQTLDVHLWGPNLFQTIAYRWTTRLPRSPQLQMLGFGTGSAASPVYPRQAELTRFLFEEAGWNADEFIGYRCHEEYPIWRAGYRIALDFTGSTAPDTPG